MGPPLALWLMVHFKPSLLYLQACALHQQSFFFEVIILWIRKLNCTGSTTPHLPAQSQSMLISSPRSHTATADAFSLLRKLSSSVSCLFSFINCYHVFCFICWLREHSLNKFASLCIILKFFFSGGLEKLGCTRVKPHPGPRNPSDWTTRELHIQLLVTGQKGASVTELGNDSWELCGIETEEEAFFSL